jgi:hypothetical protein
VDPKTVKHLQISLRNRELARALLGPAQAGLQPAPWEWVVVITFYAAVHAVNAYLWETRRYEPSSHGDRRNLIQTSPQLGGCTFGYRILTRAGFDARYDENYTASQTTTHMLLNVHFRQVEATVMQALRQPAPVW